MREAQFGNKLMRLLNSALVQIDPIIVLNHLLNAVAFVGLKTGVPYQVADDIMNECWNRLSSVKDAAKRVNEVRHSARPGLYAADGSLAKPGRKVETGPRVR